MTNWTDDNQCKGQKGVFLSRIFERLHALIRRLRWQTNTQILLALLIVWLSFDTTTNLTSLIEQIRQRAAIADRASQSMPLYLPDNTVGNFAHTPLSAWTVGEVSNLFVGPQYPDIASFDTNRCGHLLGRTLGPGERALGPKERIRLLDKTIYLDILPVQSLVSKMMGTAIFRCVFDESSDHYTAWLSGDLPELPIYSYIGQRIHYQPADQYVYSAASADWHLRSDYLAWQLGKPSFSETHGDEALELSEETRAMQQYYRLIRREMLSVVYHAIAERRQNEDQQEEIITILATLQELDGLLDGRPSNRYGLDVWDGELAVLIQSFNQVINDRKVSENVSLAAAVDATQDTIRINLLQLDIPRTPAKVVLPILLLVVSLIMLASSRSFLRAAHTYEGEPLWTDWYAVTRGRFEALLTVMVLFITPLCAVIFVYRQFSILETVPGAISAAASLSVVIAQFLIGRSWSKARERLLSRESDWRRPADLIGERHDADGLLVSAEKLDSNPGDDSNGMSSANISS